MKVISLAEKKEYKKELDSINEKAWPEFMLNWDCKEWSHLFTTFENYQILLINNEEELMAYGHTIPIYWDEDIRFIPDNLKILMEMAVKNNKDSKPFDPWLRVHKKLGGKVFKTAEISMIIRGKINEWEKWTNTVICGSGKYIFEDALNPVEIDIEKNKGIYTDPCVWIHYSLK